MITIHEATANDFTTLGLGALSPIECIIDEMAGGLYELKIVQPISDDGKYAWLTPSRIIKAPAPMRETPLLELNHTGSVDREIYRVSTGGARLNMRSSPNGKIMHAYEPGTEVVKLDQSNDSTWLQVALVDGGATGWMYKQYLTYVRTETEIVLGDTPGLVQPRQTREQLFRIVDTEPDTKLRTVTAWAEHITYDLKGAIVTGKYEPEGVAAHVVCAQLMARADHDVSDFHVYCAVDGKVTGNYGGRNILDCLLDPETGVVAQTGARVVRDNYDIFLLPDEERIRGAEIRYGKNLLSAAMTTSVADVITRIYPTGKNSDGEKLYIDDEGGGYVDSEHIGDYPIVYAKEIDYDVAVSDELTVDEARAQLVEKALAEFASGCDLPTVRLDAEFIRLELTDDYKDLANAYALHLYDTVPVIDREAGIVAAVRMTRYSYDGVLDEYKTTGLGEISDVTSTVNGFELASTGISGAKILPGSLMGDRLQNASVGYGKFDVAAIAQLAINALIAMRDDVRQIVENGATDDQLYIDLANIAAGQLTTDNIKKADINWGTVSQLMSVVASVAKAHIADAEISWDQIKDIAAEVAKIADMQIGGATIDWAQIVNAKIDWADIGNVEIDWAQIKNAAIETAKIADAQIGKATIDVAQIRDLEAETAKIADAQIGKATIDWAQITDVKITNTDIEDATIGTAKIALGAITSALIGAGAIETAQIADGSITDAKIVSLNADVIKAGTLSVERLLLKGPEGLFYAINATDEGLTSTQLSEEQYQSMISGTVLVAHSITADKIAAQTITANEILAGTITAAEINVVDLFAAAATITELNNYILRTSTIEALEGKLDVWASNKITQTITDEDGYVNTKIEQTASGIRSEVNSKISSVNSRITQTANSIRSEVSDDISGINTTIEQTANDIRLEVSAKANKGDPASAVDTGAGIVIDADGVTVEGGKIELRANAGDQYLSITPEAIAASSMDAPNVAPRYDGPASITVNSAATSAQIATGSYYRSLTDAFNALSGRYLDYNVTISVKSDGYGYAQLGGVCGTGSITVNGNSFTQYGAVRLMQNSVYVKVNYLNVTRTAAEGTAWAMLVTACVYVELLWCVFDGNGAADALYLSEGTRAWVRECEFYGTTGKTLITAQYCVDLTVLNAKGGNATYFAYTDGATVKWSGTRPDGTWSQGNTSLTAPADLSSLTMDSGDAPATAPTIRTANYSMQYADTYARGNVAGWDYPDWSPNNDIYQGYTGHAGRVSGCMWFNNTTIRSALSGKTIKQASLRLTAQRFVGTGRAVQIQLCGTSTEYASRSSAPPLTKNYGIIGSATPGETAEITIPTGVITDLVAGTINGLMLYSTDTANYEDRNYSLNYARFDGSTSGDSTTRPRLTVMYS